MANLDSSFVDPDQVRVQHAHFIGGEYLKSSGDDIDVALPSDGRVYASVQAAAADEVDNAAENAARAFRESDWARRAPRDRARVLRRWAELIEADVDTLAPMEAVGSTRPLRDATTFDVPYTAESIRFFAEYADKVGGE